MKPLVNKAYSAGTWICVEQYDSSFHHGNGGPGSREISLETAYQRFVEHNIGKNLAAKTHRFYFQQVLPFVDWCHNVGVHTASDATTQIIAEYLATRRRSGLKDISIQSAYRALRAFFNFCVNQEIVPVSPMEKMSMPRAEKRLKPIFRREDIINLLRACTCRRDSAVLLALIDTGVRASELVNLRGRDVDLDGGRIHIRLGKGKKDRYVFIGDETRRAIIKYYEDRGAPSPGDQIWLSHTTSEPLQQNGLNQMLRKLGRKAGVKNVSPHTFRRSFAVMSLEQGIDLYRLAELLGHTDIAVLKSYLPLVERHAREAHDRFGPLNGFGGELSELIR